MLKYILLTIIISVSVIATLDVDTGYSLNPEIKLGDYDRTDFAYLGKNNSFTADNFFWGNTFFMNVVYVNQTNLNVSGSVNATEYCIDDQCVSDLSLIINVPDTNASTACTGNEVLLGSGNCIDLTVDTNASNCGDGEYLDGDTNCYNFNTSVDNILATITYLPTSVYTEYGTVDAGNLASLQGFNDGDSYNVSEVVGAPGLRVYINFTNVEDFNEGIIREQYSGGSGHTIHIGVWNYNTLTWDEDWSEITDQADFVIITGTVFGANNYIGTGDDLGVVQIRLDHDDSGNINHDLFIDVIYITDGFQSTVTTSHDSLSNRDNIENHPWAKPTDASRNFTDHVNLPANKNLTTDFIQSVSGNGINLMDLLVFKNSETIDNINDGEIRVTANFNATGSGQFTDNVTIGNDDTNVSYGRDFSNTHVWTNSSNVINANLSDQGSYYAKEVCDDNGCIAKGEPFYIHWAENQDLTDATAEWSIANGEVGVFIHVLDDATITNMGLWCNTVIGTVNITVQKYGAPVTDIGCNLNGTAPFNNTCSVDVSAGDMLRPYTFKDTGHVSCALTMRLETR